MKRVNLGKGLLLAAIIVMMGGGAWASGGLAPVVQKNCMNCHAGLRDMTNVLAGNLSAKSMKAKTIQVKINNKMELVRFTEATTVENIPNLKALKGSVALRVHYEMAGTDRVATEVVVKPKFEVPEKQLIGVRDLAALVAQGPEKGNYSLIDSRPPAGFAKGHIPTAISIPFPKMKALSDKLPQDKDQTVIFYCQGFR